MQHDNIIDFFEARAYCIPTDQLESDGTLCWNSTTLVVVFLGSGNVKGMGYTYSDKSLVPLLENMCTKLVLGNPADSHPFILNSLHNNIRNLGDTGLTSMAISAVDNALWDLRARLYDSSLLDFLGISKYSIEAYASGGFTSYSMDQLQKEMSAWRESGFRAVKMKIGREKNKDRERLEITRKAIGESVDLFVDANGAYNSKEALSIARMLIEYDVVWFEEPVWHSDKSGLLFIREHCLAPLRVASGEYGFDLNYFKDLLINKCVDVIQADATRCGTTGFLQASSLCEAFNIPLSAHTAPSLHMHLCCAVKSAINVEYFHDHARIEQMIFEGAANANNGWLIPDRSAPGNGLLLKHADAERFRCS